MQAILSAITAFFFGSLITPALIFILKKGNFIESPGGRKIHTGYIPSMGGVAIILAAFFGIFTWFSLEQMVHTRYFLVGMGIMFSVGLRDDLIELSAIQKLIGQCIPAFFVIVMADIRVTSFYGFLGIYEIPFYLSLFISFLILIVMTNAFNLIDGTDGLAATLSIVSFTFLAWWFYDAGMPAYSLISITLVGGIFSFLIFNWHPAKIFMGDTGSLSLGFALTSLVILFVNKNGTMLESEGWKFQAPIAAGIALLIVPIYDTIRIFIKRVLNGRSPLKPDKSHIHHFLLRMGFGHDKVAIILGIVKILFIGIVVLGSELNDHVMLPILVLSTVTMGIYLDRKTLKSVRKICKDSPAILSETETAVKTAKKSQRTKVFEKFFDPEKINMN